jgi:hypothetical protein
MNEATLGAVKTEPRRAIIDPWTALLGRLQAIWMSQPEAPPRGHRSTNERGGNGIRWEQWIGSPCASQSVCIEQESDRRERMCEEMTCESEDACGDCASPGEERCDDR